MGENHNMTEAMINEPLVKACKHLQLVSDCPQDPLDHEHPGGCGDICGIVDGNRWACWYQYFEGEMQPLWKEGKDNG